MSEEIRKKIEEMYARVNETYRGGMIQAAEFGYQLAQEEQPDQDELWNELEDNCMGYDEWSGGFLVIGEAKKRYRITRI